MSDPAPDLTPDCRSCDALCCVLLAFDEGSAFGYSKPACTACKNLAPDNRCRIHDSLAAQGFKGCIQFDCHGAGQYVTQITFKGRSWRNDPGLMPAIDEAFRLRRRLHEAMALLVRAVTLPLSQAQHAEREALLASLADGTEETLAQTAAYLASLRGVTPPRR